MAVEESKLVESIASNFAYPQLFWRKHKDLKVQAKKLLSSSKID